MEGISGVHIEVDDLLIEAKEMLEALDILRQVLTRARLKNIKLARHKIEFGTQIEFAGVHLGGPDGYRPTTACSNKSHRTKKLPQMLESTPPLYTRLQPQCVPYADSTEEGHTLRLRQTHAS